MRSRPALPPLDPARSLWLPVTVHVAWELVIARVPVRPRLLADVREHVLRSLPIGTSEDELEELTRLLVQDYLARAHEHRYRRVAALCDLDCAPPRQWRERVIAALDHVSDAVWRMHYSDRMPMETVARHAAIDRTTLAAAREGIREIVRVVAATDGQPLDDWSDARLDRLIGRLASYPEPGCPGPVGLLGDAGREHADRCPRCSRAIRLIRGGILSPGDLLAPEGRSAVPGGTVQILALLVHPDARRHVRRLEQVLSRTDAVRAGPEAWLVPGADLAVLAPGLARLAAEATPPRHHLRGALLQGPGRWSGGVLLGPLPVEALERARACPWSELQGMPPLPAPRPPPPRATGWWVAAGLSLLAAVATGIWVLRPRTMPPPTPLEAAWTPTRHGWDVRFDTDDLAVVDVIARRSDGLHTIARSRRVGKAEWATGEGDYQLHVDGDEVALVSSPNGVANLADLVAQASHAPRPLQALATALHAAWPAADVAVSPSSEPSVADR